MRLQNKALIVTGSTTGIGEAIARRYPSASSGGDCAMVTVGSQEAMFAVCLALVDAGQELLYPDPGYPAYATLARLIGATPMLTLILNKRPCQMKRYCSTAWRTESAISRARASGHDSSRMPNSSPPRRASVSLSRTNPPKTPANCLSSSSPATCPQVSLMILN